MDACRLNMWTLSDNYQPEVHNGLRGTCAPSKPRVSLVRVERLELSQVALQAPKACASTNSATLARHGASIPEPPA